MLARSTHDEQFSRLTVHNRSRVTVTVVKALAPLVTVGNHYGSAPCLAVILANLAHNVDSLVAADVGVAGVPVVGNGEQPAVRQLHDGGDAIVVPGSDVGVKHRRDDGIIGGVNGRRCRCCSIQNDIDDLVHVSDIHLAVTVHVGIDALSACSLC